MIVVGIVFYLGLVYEPCIGILISGKDPGFKKFTGGAIYRVQVIAVVSPVCSPKRGGGRFLKGISLDGCGIEQEKALEDLASFQAAFSCLLHCSPHSARWPSRKRWQLFYAVLKFAQYAYYV